MLSNHTEAPCSARPSPHPSKGFHDQGASAKPYSDMAKTIRLTATYTASWKNQPNLAPGACAPMFDFFGA